MTATTAHHIARSNAMLARAAGMRLGADGPGPARTLHPQMTCALILLVALAALTLAKALLIALIGADAYGAALALLQAGGLADQAGALVLGADAATRALAALMM